MRVVEATELLALDVFGSGARQITLSDVEHYLGHLRSHSPESRCGCCQAGAIVRPDRVLMVVRSWQRQVRATKVRGSAEAIDDVGPSTSHQPGHDLDS